MRRLGYAPHENKSGLSFVRRILGTDYPRFHIYLKEENDHLVINLHLDQKKPIYAGSRAHSGEYEGEIVENELKRIAALIE